MLFTRCPDCDTTFRVTDEALKKAHGQVRCGRCASVFNAYAELQQPRSVPPPTDPAPSESTPAESPLAQPETTPTSELAPAAATIPGLAVPEIEEPGPMAAADEPPALGTITITPLVPLETRVAPSPTVAPPSADAVAASIGAASAAEIVAEVDANTTDADAATGEMEAPFPPPEDTISPAAVDEVLGAADTAKHKAVELPPLPFGTPAVQRRSRWWSVAALGALLALGVQAVNHYRSDLAGDTRVGSWVQNAYARIGIPVTPNWDVRQYEILDWIATAEPNTRGLGSLKITARIQNRGPSRQPFPSVQLQLKDRWEEAVGRRMFAPAEYLPRNAALGRMMAPGETARAELEIVDPGPDAYGFELDVCIELERSQLSCGNDKVFL